MISYMFLDCFFITAHRIHIISSTPKNKAPYIRRYFWKSNLNHLFAKSQKILRKLLVPKAGFEPARPCGHSALNAARLPVPPLRHFTCIINYNLSLINCKEALSKIIPVNDPIPIFVAGLCRRFTKYQNMGIPSATIVTPP